MTRLSRVERARAERKRARNEWWKSLASKMLIALLMKFIDFAFQWLF